MGDLLERSGQLAVLRDALASVRGGRGVLALLSGEAGGGKTALVRRFCDEAEHVLWGACDPLFTPRPLGPFVDMGHQVAESGAKPHQVAAALAHEARSRPGTVIVVDDLHWADEATLDVLTMLGRRIETVPALVIATYRDDEVDRTHPLRWLLGELRSTSSIRRLTAQPLSVEAVASLAEPHGLDGPALHRATGGNPFFVTEVLAAREGGPAREGRDASIPATVRDAVLARLARLDAAATAVVEAVSVALPQAELWLLDALVPDPADGLERCLYTGILEVVPGGVAFRHELARIAVERSLPPHRRADLHRRALAALTGAPAAGAVELARLAYHADAAGDAEAVLRFGRAAAEHAAATGAHREAAAHYQRALRFGDRLPPAELALLYESLSLECYLTDQIEAAIDALRRAIGHWRATGDELRVGVALSQLSRRLWCGGHSAEAATVGRQAIDLLEPQPQGPELALAYSNLASIALNDERFDDALSWGTRALALAETHEAKPVVVHSLNNLGTMRLLAGGKDGLDDGLEELERSLAIAERAGLDEHVGRVFIHLGWAMTRTRAYHLADRLDRGLEVCEELGLEAWKQYVTAYRARYLLDAGRWDAAAADATSVLRSARSVPLLHILGLSVLALVRARRGDPEQWPPLDRARELLGGQDELQYHAPVAVARAEVALLNGRADLVVAETERTLAIAVDRGASWVVGELAWLRRLAGVSEVVPGVAEPYASQLAGAGPVAAARWTDLGCPYDAALALVESRDEADLRHAHAEFQRLGARPAAGIVARRLREHGVRGVPRGPRPSTRQHAAGLTRRETEVLALVQQGSTNAEIAAQLFVSEKTVHHHMSAILRKLGVDSRGKAATEAARRGLTQADT